ncbi:hypothetical protein FPZ12_009375 [Amycolatopsis acidicola]|uniref:Uncharacterized protein n=1 Tax=Amycolatopsis acidicola TaxID=2596893 RepID=A0A5N0V9Z2_9PSEU|nr:hypothetical protein [Amycolatopsis acidicola]KAA9163207.1 hypothetical protein FPZ12_009375 [Amycolatopsis acidicola]
MNSERENADTTENAVVIPFPRRSTTDPAWTYRQSGHRTRSRRFVGTAIRVGGAEGRRLRRELASITADLLRWAAQQQQVDKATEENQERAA